MTQELKATASTLRTWLNRLVLPYGQKVLVNPLTLNFKAGVIHARNFSTYKSTFVEGTIRDAGISGEGEVTVDSERLLKFLSNYDDACPVTITFGEVITISGGGKKSTIYPEALTNQLPDLLPKFENGVIQYQTGPSPGPPTTFSAVKGGVFDTIIKDAQTVEVATFPLSFSPERNVASVGSHEAKHDMIETVFTAEQVQTTGPVVATSVGEDLIYVATNLDGGLKTQLQLKPEYPLVIRAEGEKTPETYFYIISPRAGDDEE